jgi:misacylated tRNA(Ala) deacylase
VNAVIARDLKVTEEYMPMGEAEKIVDLSKLPNDVSETLRIVRIGDYDVCACIGEHVERTSEIGRFEIISHDYENGRWRVRFKLRESE